MDPDEKTNPAAVRLVCIRGLSLGLEHALEGNGEEDRYEVDPFENNLVPGLEYVCGAGLIGPWLYDLLEEYMSLVQSSAALAVNCFGPLLLAGIPFDLGSHRDLRVEAIGRATRRGFEEPDEPALHVTAVGPSGTVVIDVSCLDYLNATRPTSFARASPVGLQHPGSRPIEEVGKRTNGAPRQMLDVATLFDRARGKGGDSAAPPAALTYLFWEPLDADFSPLFARHREEIKAFAQQLSENAPRFEAISCFALWDAWAASEDPRLRTHAAALRARYEVPAWAWEGVEWIDGRLGTADWLMDLADDPEANRVAAMETIKRAVKEYGFTEEEARGLFGNCLNPAKQ